MSAAATCRRSLDSPLGRLSVTVTDGDAVTIDWGRSRPDSSRDKGTPEATLADDLVARLRTYFAGGVVNFDDVPLPRGTAFRRRCWEACRRIPRGQTRSYAELATMAGSPGAARAAGGAMRHNPLPLIVPCHRVIASDGRLGGFAGQTDPECNDLARKRFLLTLEGAADRGDAPPTAAHASVPVAG